MALLALFIRALRQEIRSRAVYSTRSCYLLVVVIFASFMAASAMWKGAPGLQVFRSLIWINLLFIVGASLAYFSSAVAEEKEENTLGLLRMTDLNALSILLGKSTSRLLGAVMLLAVGFPFTALVITLGGVSLDQIAAAYVALGAYLFFVANLGLLTSVICPRASHAGLFSGLAQAGLCLGPSIIAEIEEFSLRLVPFEADPGWMQSAVYHWWRALPGTQLSSILQTGFAEPIFGRPALLTLAAGVGCFLLAWVLFEPCCGLAKSREALPTPRPLGRARRNSGRAWTRLALMWKDYNFISGGPWIRWGKVLGMLAIVAMIWSDDIRNQRFTVENCGSSLLTIGLLFWSLEMLLLSGRVFRSEWRDRTLSSLALLPMPMSQIAHQKVAGCLLATWPGLLAALIGWVMTSSKSGPNTIIGFWFSVGLIVVGVFLLHLTAWLSLRLKYGAIPAAVVITLLLIQLATMGIGAIFGLIAMWAGNRWMISEKIIGFSMLGLGLSGIAILHLTIAPRLTRLAAEEG